jgi:hypothetical protein
MRLSFEWDAEKARENRRKHGVSFEEAIEVLSDALSITIDDPDHSTAERRHIDVGARLIRVIRAVSSW